MILVLGGTKDARLAVEMLTARGHRVLACAATVYGGELLAGAGAALVSDRPLGRQELAALLDNHAIRAVIDATHPYAAAISALAAELCAEKGIPCYRYQRPETILPEHPLLTFADDYEAAAALAVELGEIIFLTTGSKTLDTFVKAARARGRRVVARVLPDPQVLARCLSLGLTPADIVAVQGPFSRELNRALFQHYGARVLVTKDSGTAGGTLEKIEAALELAIPVVVVGRPEPVKGWRADLEELIRVLQ